MAAVIDLLLLDDRLRADIPVDLDDLETTGRFNNKVYYHRTVKFNSSDPRSFFVNYLRYSVNEAAQWVYYVRDARDQRVAPTFKWVVKRTPREGAGYRELVAIMTLATGNTYSQHMSRVSAILFLSNSDNWVYSFYFIWRYEGTSVPQLLLRDDIPSDTWTRRDDWLSWLSDGAVTEKFYNELMLAVEYQYSCGIINLDYKLRNVIYHPRMHRFVCIDVSKVYFRQFDDNTETKFAVIDDMPAQLNLATSLSVAKLMALVQIKSTLPRGMHARWQQKIDEATGLV